MIGNYSSLHFFQTYLFKGNIPQGTRAPALMEWDLKDNIDHALDSLLQEISGNGGWTAYGCAKHGKVEDRAASDPATNNNAYNVAPKVYA